MIADAVRIQPMYGPKIQISQDTVLLQSNSKVDYRTALANAPVAKLFTITNVGTRAMELYSIAASGGFTVLDPIETTVTLAPGQQRTFRVQLPATATGTFDGVVSIVTNDADTSNSSFAVTGKVDSRRVLDDADTGSAYQSSIWRIGAADKRYYRSTHHYSASNSTAAATWTFDDLQPGRYAVYATWYEYANRTDRAYYTVSAPGAGSYAAPVVNQRLAPATMSVAGDDPVNPPKNVAWQQISPAGGFVVSNADGNWQTTETLTVSLASSNRGYVIADAIRIECLPTLTAGGTAESYAGERLTSAALAPVVAESLARYQAAGLDATQLAVLAQTRLVVADLGGQTLGVAAAGPRTIVLDDDAAGFGWFLDPTPGEDEEFSLPLGSAKAAAASSLAYGKMDLLSAVMHEMGHILGKSDLDSAADELMADRLSAGVRRSVGAESSSLHDAVLAAR